MATLVLRLYEQTREPDIKARCLNVLDSQKRTAAGSASDEGHRNCLLEWAVLRDFLFETKRPIRPSMQIASGDESLNHQRAGA